MTLDRPSALNASSPDMVGELRDHIFALKVRRDVRVVILRGEGRAYRGR